MMEYIKRKLTKTKDDQAWKDQIGYPHYYQENGLFIKETEDGEKFVVTLDEQHQEIIVGKAK